MLTTVDVDKQKAFSKEMNTLMFDEAMVIPIWRPEPGAVAGPLYIDGVHDAGFNYGQAAPFWKPETVWLEKKAWLSK